MCWCWCSPDASAAGLACSAIDPYAATELHRSSMLCRAVLSCCIMLCHAVRTSLRLLRGLSQLPNTSSVRFSTSDW